MIVPRRSATTIVGNKVSDTFLVDLPYRVVADTELGGAFAESAIGGHEGQLIGEGRSEVQSVKRP